MQALFHDSGMKESVVKDTAVKISVTNIVSGKSELQNGKSYPSNLSYR